MTEKSYPIFQPPEDPNTIDPNTMVWRFMDIAKYVDLISSGNLFFSRVDKLEDEYEGSLPVANKEYELGLLLASKLNREAQIRIWRREKTRERLRMWRYINCWFMKPQESYLMWQVYTQSAKQGIVIQSTYSQLQNIQQNFQQEKCKMHLGQVNYIDYEKESIPNDPISPFMHKRNYYEDEQEVRLLITEKPNIIDRLYPLLDSRITPNRKNGVLVSVALRQLIEAVYVSPDSEDWFFELVQKVTEQYMSKYKFQIQKSKMSGRPSY